MTEQQEVAPTDHHDQWVSLIPWYVKGTLDYQEQVLIKEHLLHCEICRQEAASCAALALSMPLPAETWKPSAAHFSGIMAAVDKLEAAATSHANPPEAISKPKAKPKTGFFQHINDWLSQTPSPVRWALAVETLAVTALALLMVLPSLPKLSSTDAYETLSSAETPVKSIDSTLIRLVFSEDMTTKDMSDLLQHAKSQIQQGPSAVGSYTVSVATKDAAQALTLLRGNPKVRLAQPIESAKTE